ncbi:MAG TPA: DinB family protein [Candidatus Dormibacteraeota bacterium]|nr:DinB family protein [Candidatus Dormibacteraeota bacterium]
MLVLPAHRHRRHGSDPEESNVSELGRWLEGLYACNAWVMENMLEASRRLAPEDLTRDRRGAYGSILTTLAHVVGAHQVWSARLDGSSPTALPGTDAMPTLDDVGVAFRKVSKEYRSRIARLTPAEAKRIVSYRTTAGTFEEHPVDAILLHVSLHTSNHLAQVATLLTQAGVEPPRVDYMDWVRAGRP